VCPLAPGSALHLRRKILTRFPLFSASKFYDPRLRPQRHHDTVRSLRGRHRPRRAGLPVASRHQEFRRFLKQVAKAYPRVNLHVPANNYATHKHPRGEGMAAAEPARHRALHADLGILTEHGRDLLRIITRQAIRRGTFGSVRELIEAITAFIDGWNDRCQPFIWTKDADAIIAKATATTFRDATLGTGIALSSAGPGACRVILLLGVPVVQPEYVVEQLDGSADGRPPDLETDG
jgi:hypothetical protein